MTELPAAIVAFSGGLSSSYLVARYARSGHRVVAVTVDSGALGPEAPASLALLHRR